MQFPTVLLALAASCSFVLAAPLGQSAGSGSPEPRTDEAHDMLQMRGTLEQWDAQEGHDIQAREPLFGLKSKAPKVDYQVCAMIYSFVCLFSSFCMRACGLLLGFSNPISPHPPLFQYLFPLLRVNGFTNRWVHGYLAMLCKLRKSFLSLVLFDFYIYFWGYLSPSLLPPVSGKYPPPFPSPLFYIMLILPEQSTQKTNCAGQGN